MLNILYTELFKLKSSKMLWLIVIGAFLSNLFSWWAAYYSLGAPEPLPTGAVMINIELSMNMIVAPLVYYLFTGYIVGREYQEKTINNMFTTPYPRSLFVIGKLLTMLLMIAALSILTYLFMIGGAWVYHNPSLTPELMWIHLQMNVVMVLVHFALIPMAFSVSYVSKSYFAPMILVFVVMLMSPYMLTSESEYRVLFPWLAPVFLTSHVLSHNEVNIGLMVVTLVIAFVVPFLFNLYYVEKSDVRSGS